MSLLDIAQMRKGTLRDGYSANKAGASVAETRVEYGTATADSVDGMVTIVMDNSTQSFEVPCESPISQGDRVSYISTRGKGKAVSVATLAQIAQEAEDVATATNQHFWSDTNGIHVSTDEAEPAGTRNILINSLGILLRKAAQTLVSITESAVAFFDGNGNQTASFGQGGATIGTEGNSQTFVTSDGIRVDAADGDTILNVQVPVVVESVETGYLVSAAQTSSTITWQAGASSLTVPVYVCDYVLSTPVRADKLEVEWFDWSDNREPIPSAYATGTMLMFLDNVLYTGTAKGSASANVYMTPSSSSSTSIRFDGHTVTCDTLPVATEAYVFLTRTTNANWYLTGFRAYISQDAFDSSTTQSRFFARFNDPTLEASFVASYLESESIIRVGSETEANISMDGGEVSFSDGENEGFFRIGAVDAASSPTGTDLAYITADRDMRLATPTGDTVYVAGGMSINTYDDRFYVNAISSQADPGIMLASSQTRVSGNLRVTGNTILDNPLATQYGGVPAGGSTGQVLAKASASDRDLTWVSQSSGSSQVVFYGTSTTAAATAAKVVACSDFSSSDLKAGTVLYVRFTYAQTYNGNPTLNVNSTGAVSVKRYGTTNAARYEWVAGEVICFVHDGTYWIISDGGIATTTYYGMTKLSSAVDSTSAALAATPAAVKSAYDLASGKSTIGHTHGLSTATAQAVGTFTANTPTSVTLPTFDYETEQIPSISAKTVVTGGSTTSIPNITVAAASTDTVTGVGTFTPNTPTAVTLPALSTSTETVLTGFTANTPTSASVANGVLTITAGTAASATTGTVEAVNTWTAGSVTAGTAASLTTTSKTFNTNATRASAGTPIEAYTSLTTGDSITVGTPKQVTIVDVTDEGSVTAGTAASLTTSNVTVLTSSTTDASTN